MKQLVCLFLLFTLLPNFSSFGQEYWAEEQNQPLVIDGQKEHWPKQHWAEDSSYAFGFSYQSTKL
ncbi:MAG: hypothetical protein AAF696_30925, partial [Bacteroidota bacterium]